MAGDQDETGFEDMGYPPDDSGGGTNPPSSVPAVRSAQIRQRVMASKPKARKQRNKTSASKILAKEKQRQALELRKGGASYPAIAQALGYGDPSGARKAVEAAMKQVTQEPAVELKTLNIERLNHMLLTLWPKVQQGDERAIDTSLRVLDKIDRLMGTEAAQQVDVNVNQTNAILVIDGSKEDYLRSLRQMAGISGDGTNAPAASMAALGPAAAPPSGVIEGTVVDDRVNPDPPEEVPLWGNDSASAPEQPKKQYKFGVDPRPNER